MKTKKFLSLIAAFMLMLALLPMAVFADDTDTPAVVEGTEVLQANANTTSAAILHFGQQSWVVINYGESTATLLASGNIGLTYYDNVSPYSNAYGDSVLKEKVDAIANGLSTGEKGAISKRTLEGNSANYGEDGYDNDHISGDSVEGAYLWPLSVAEANNVNNDLRVVDPEHPGWASSYWWLRSPGDNVSTAAFVDGYGYVSILGFDVVTSEYGVRPAFYLNLESVIFTSAAEGGKSCTEGALTQIGTNSTNEWKVTVKDSGRNFSAQATSGIKEDNSVDIEYSSKYGSGVVYGEAQFISAVIENSEGKLTHYGRLKKVATPADAEGTLTVTLPEGWSDTDTLYLFSEEYNGAYSEQHFEGKDILTDYASALVEITPLKDFTVTVVGGKADKATAHVGDTVTITADTPEAGKAFVQWAHVDGVDFGNASSTSTSFTMPAKDVTVTAVCAPIIIKNIDDKVYTGSYIEPTDEVKVSLEGVDMLLTTDDYTVSFEDNLNAGDAKVIVTMKSPRAGSATGTFKINKAPLTSIGLSVSDKVYDGANTATINVTIPSDATGKVTVTVTDPQNISSDYDVTIGETDGGKGSYALTNLAVGEYSVTAAYEGDGNYLPGSTEAPVKFKVTHDMKEVPGAQETCTEDGNKPYYICNGCGKWFIDSEGENEITDHNEVVIPKKGHSFTKYVSNDDATCTKDGTKTAKCDNCDATDTVTDEGSAKGHSFTNYKSNGDATCTKDGTKTAKCDNCDATDTVEDKGSAKGHSFTKYVSNGDATCTKDGTKTAKCDNCDATDTVTDEGSAKGHSFTNYKSNGDATCTKDGTKTAKCDNCDATDTVTDKGSATGHTWKFENITWTGNEKDGYTKAVANFVCENDSTHKDTVEATITETVTDPTTTTTGKTTYSATIPADKSPDGKKHDATNTENAEKEAKVTDKIVYTVTEGDGAKWTKGSSETLDATFKRSVDDDTTFDRCRKIVVDGKTELTDADCTRSKGSLKISIKSSFLETLAEGKHTLVVTFDDGDSPEMTFTIEAKPKEETKPADTTPKTGDNNNIGLWAAVMGGALLLIILLILAGRKLLKKQR